MASPQTENGFVRIATELLEALCRTHLGDHSRRVFGAIMRMTYGYNKTRNAVSLSDLADMTCIDRANVKRAVKWLLKARMIGRVSGDPTKATTYWVEKNYDKWRVGSHQTPGSHRSKTGVSPAPTLLVVKDNKDKGPTIPSELDTPLFKAAWADWNQHRKEKGKKLTPLSVKKQMNQMVKWGVDRAILAINHSITKGWLSIFEDDKATSPKMVRQTLNQGGTGRLVH